MLKNHIIVDIDYFPINIMIQKSIKSKWSNATKNYNIMFGKMNTIEKTNMNTYIDIWQIEKITLWNFS